MDGKCQKDQVVKKEEVGGKTNTKFTSDHAKSSVSKILETE
jgi:hypothetical protein